MIAALLTLAALAASAAEEPHAAALRLLAQGDVAGAWEAVAAEPDPFLRASARVRICHEAGDLAGLLEHADAALALRPADPTVLFYAAWAHVALRHAQRAAASVGRLEEAVAAAGFDGDAAGRWASLVEELRRERDDLLRIERERHARVGRARWIALVLLLGAGTVLVLLEVQGSAANPAPEP